MEVDHIILSRIQFALTVSFHIIFPTMSIGLATFLAVTEGLWLKTRNQVYLDIYRFWLKLFALGFGIGVVTGIVLSFEFGTNFSGFAQKAGPILGSIISLEVLTAFFVEAGFLGVMLFGWGKVSERMHWFATCTLAFGTLLSASWIMAANSWMQTPAGYALLNGRFVAIDWLAVVFNPSYLYRLPHMLMAAWLTASFFVAGVGAWYLLRDRHVAFGRKCLSLGMGFAAVLIPIQVALGDVLAGVMADHQPAKIQAVEGNWETTTSAPYLIFIAPNSAEERNDVAIGIPYLGSLFVTHTLDGAVPGLKESPKDRRPPIGWVFYAFRVMFFIGILMFIAAAASIWLRWRGRLFDTRWFLHFCVSMMPAGFLATLGGWYTAEIGRQPFVVFGLLRTIDAASPVSTGSVAASLMLFACFDAVLLFSFLYFFRRTLLKGPVEEEHPKIYRGTIGGGMLKPVKAASPSPMNDGAVAFLGRSARGSEQ